MFELYGLNLEELYLIRKNLTSYKLFVANHFLLPIFRSLDLSHHKSHRYDLRNAILAFFRHCFLGVPDNLVGLVRHLQ